MDLNLYYKTNFIQNHHGCRLRENKNVNKQVAINNEQDEARSRILTA